MESLIPLFAAKSLDEVTAFYRALGFEVPYQQETPYLYAAVQRGQIGIHFTNKTHGAACLVHVSKVDGYHRAFADGLREAYGRVPLAETPRLTRLRPSQTRFSVYDPAGNTLTFINIDEPDIDYDAYNDSTLSPLMQALENVQFLRDTYHDDPAAAKFLDKKLKQLTDAAPIERARALAARAELAVAMGESARLAEVRAELGQLSLTDDERARHHDELTAADHLERWAVEKAE